MDTDDPMPQSIYYYSQPKGVRGYQLVVPEHKGQNDKIIRWDDGPGITHRDDEYQSKVYFLLDDYPFLFLDFANLEMTEKSILEFASQYGFLGVYEPFALVEGCKHVKFVEPVKRWYAHIRKMREAVFLWEAVNKKNYNRLRGLIEWDQTQKKTFIRHRYNYDDSWCTIIDSDDPAFHKIPDHSRMKPALLGLQRLINDIYKEHVSIRLVFDPEFKEQRQYIIPDTMLGAVWLQLAQHVDGSKGYRHCAYCKRPFSVNPYERGRKRKFCPSLEAKGSSTCADRYNNRKKRAAKGKRPVH